MSLPVRVVIPTLGSELLAEAVASALDASEIVVVDGRTSPPAPPTPARLVAPGKNLGFAGACNAGAADASLPWVLFLNDDARLVPGALNAMLDAAAGAAAAVVQPVVMREGEGEVESAGDLVTRAGFLWHLRGESSGEVFAANGAAIMVRTEWFRLLGGFRQDYFAYFEESDLCWRMKMAGRAIVCAPARAVHVGGATSAKMFTAAQLHELAYRNRWRSILANAGRGTLMFMAPAHALSCVAIAAVFALRGRADVAGAVLRAMAWPLRHPFVLVEQRRSAQALRRCADRDVLRPRARLSAARAAALLTGNLRRWR